MEEDECYDREECLDRVGVDAATYWNLTEDEWQDDKEFVLKALRESPTLPREFDFEGRFLYPSLQHDRDILIAFWNRHDIHKLYHEEHRQLDIPDSLMGDKKVVMACCKVMPILNRCTDELRDDPDVVQACTSLSGLQLQFASRRLQNDPDFVKMVCQSDGRALEYCPPGTTRDALVSDRDFMCHTVLATPNGGTMWKYLPEHLQMQDEELLFQALMHGLQLCDIPEQVSFTSDFLQRVIQERPDLYLQLDPVWKEHRTLALTAIVANDTSRDVQKEAMAFCPMLKRDRDVVLAVCQKGDVELMEELLLSCSEFANDREIMNIAVQREGRFFHIASKRLRENVDFALAVMQPASAYLILSSVPFHIRRQNTEIIVRSLELCHKQELAWIYSCITREIWRTNRKVCLAWLKRSGGVLSEFEDLVQDDKEMALVIAEFNRADFHRVGVALLHDKSFMLRALEFDGGLLSQTSDELREDFELQLTAVAHYNCNPIRAASNAFTLSGIINLSALRKRIQDQLELHAVFVYDILGSISIVTNWVEDNTQEHTEPCYLPLLNKALKLQNP